VYLKNSGGKVMNEKFIITVGRQLGSGGRIIAKELAQILGISFYDKELIQRVSIESGVSSKFFEKADESVNPALTGGLLTDFFQDVFLSNESLFQMQSDVIRKIAETESAVFVGRCADYVLRDHPRSVHIFISANIDDRVERVAKYQGISAEKSLALIEKTDKKRASFYNYYSNKTWGAAKSYDLCINTSALGMESTTGFVLEFVRKKLNI
jgi:cytidylate kinase